MGHARSGMKEVFTKSFWQGVEKKIDQAREDPPLAEHLADSRRGRSERAFNVSDTIVASGSERNQRYYSLISVTSVGTTQRNHGGTERNLHAVRCEIGSPGSGAVPLGASALSYCKN